MQEPNTIYYLIITYSEDDTPNVEVYDDAESADYRYRCLSYNNEEFKFMPIDEGQCSEINKEN